MFGRVVVHAHEQLQSLFPGLLFQQVDGACLCQLLLYIVDGAIDRHDVCARLVDHEAHASHLQGVVDIVDITTHLLVGLGQLLQSFLSLVVVVGYIGHFASCAIDSLQSLFGITVEWLYFQFVQNGFLYMTVKGYLQSDGGIERIRLVLRNVFFLQSVEVEYMNILI